MRMKKATIRIGDEVYAGLVEIAKARGVTVADLCRSVLQSAVERRRDHVDGGWRGIPLPRCRDHELFSRHHS